jgi:hypothetical protein
MRVIQDYLPKGLPIARLWRYLNAITENSRFNLDGM